MMDAVSSLVARGSATDDKSSQFLVLTCVLTVISLTTTLLRFSAKAVRRNLGWDDYLILATSTLTIARTGLQIASIKHGNCKHVGQVSTTDYEWVVMHGWYTQLILFATLCMLKCSICLLLLRVKSTTRAQWTLGTIMGGLVVTNLEPIIILLVECSPPKTYWQPKAGTCWNPKIRIYSIYVQIAYSTLTDLLCALMPMYIVYRIRMCRRDKMLLHGLMSLGLVATVCAALRASSLGLKTTDLTYDHCIVAMWANSELHLGIIAANAACARHVYSVLRYGRNPPPKNIGCGSGGSCYRSRPGYLRCKQSKEGIENPMFLNATISMQMMNRFDEDTET